MLKPVEGGAPIAVDCEALREATIRHQAFEGKTAEGHPVVIIPDRVQPEAVGDNDVEPTILATDAAGKLLVLEPHNHVGGGGVIRLPGECNRMPSPPEERPQLAGVTAAYHLVEGRRLSDVERVPVPFDGEAVSTVCDSYVE